MGIHSTTSRNRMTSRLIFPVLAVAILGKSESAAVKSNSTQPPWSPPSFCNDLDCPKFKTLYSHPKGEYFIRQYEKSYWVSTTVLDIDYQPAVSIGFRRL